MAIKTDWYLQKLDALGPIDNSPPKEKERKKNYMLHLTTDT